MPGELRNEIYQYALTEEEGLCWNDDLQMMCTVQMSSPMTPTSNPANQLKFVDKLLRNETKGLELRYNDLAFAGTLSDINSAAEHAVSFLEQLPASRHKHLRKITLLSPRSPRHNFRESSPFWHRPVALKKLVQFCRANTHVIVRVHGFQSSICVDICPYDIFFLNVFMIAAFVHDSYDYVEKWITDPVVREKALRDMKSRLDVFRNVNHSFPAGAPANLRFMPRSCSGIVDEGKLRQDYKTMMQKPDTRTYIWPLFDEDSLVAFVRDVYEQGM